MRDSDDSTGLYPILEDSLAGRFELARAMALLRVEAERMVADFDFDRCLTLRRYLGLCRLEAEGSTPGIEAIAEALRQGLEARFARDPSDCNLLCVLALADRDRGDDALAWRRLRKVVQSGYRARALARAELAAMQAGREAAS